MPEKPRGLHAKLAEVMAEAGRIPKNGKAPAQMGGFEFVQVGDAADAIRKALGDRGVSMLPSGVEVIGEAEHATKSGGTMTTLTVRTTWTLTDGETGESAVIQSIGSGADTGDKASPKAQTNSMKYALLMGFLLSTGDDPEQTDVSDRVAGEEVELLGRIQKDGIIQKGGAERYQAEWRAEPDGYAIGFKLKLAGEDRDIPQVLVEGSIGQALYLATASSTIVGTKVTVKGHLYNVRQKGRTSYYRLIISKPETDFIETPEVRIPMLEADPLAVAAGQLGMLDDPITDEEAAAIIERERAEAAL